MVALLVQMTNPRCQRLHRELDEGLVHRDAMNAHQERPESVLRHRNPAIRGLRGPLDNGGGVEVCGTQKLVEPSTAARGMSFAMQSTTIEAMTTR
jgi:hypothetical protein